MSAAATAALLVAIGLLVLAAGACGGQMAQVKDARRRRLAGLSPDPLSTGSLPASIAPPPGGAAAGPLLPLEPALPIGIGIAAGLLRWADEAAAPAAVAEPVVEPAPAAVPVRPST